MRTFCSSEVRNVGLWHLLAIARPGGPRDHKSKCIQKLQSCSEFQMRLFPLTDTYSSSLRIWDGIKAVQRYCIQELFAASLSHLVDKASDSEARKNKESNTKKSRGKKERES